MKKTYHFRISFLGQFILSLLCLVIITGIYQAITNFNFLEIFFIISAVVYILGLITEHCTFDNEKVYTRRFFYTKTTKWVDIKNIGAINITLGYMGATELRIYLSTFSKIDEKQNNIALFRELRKYEEKYDLITVVLTPKVYKLLKQYYKGEIENEFAIRQYVLIKSLPNVKIKSKPENSHKVFDFKVRCDLAEHSYVIKLIFDSQGIFRRSYRRIIQFISWKEIKEVYLIYSDVKGREKSLICATRELTQDELSALRNSALDEEYIILPDSQNARDLLRKYWRKQFIIHNK